MGDLNRMAPGFIPVVLGDLTILVRIAIGLTATPVDQVQASDTAHGTAAIGRKWREWSYVLGGVIACVILGQFCALDFVQTLCRIEPSVAEARSLARQFLGFVRRRDLNGFDRWLPQARACAVPRCNASRPASKPTCRQCVPPSTRPEAATRPRAKSTD